MPCTTRPKSSIGSVVLSGVMISPIPKTMNPVRKTCLRPIASPKLPNVSISPMLASRYATLTHKITLGSTPKTSPSSGSAIFVIDPSTVLVRIPRPTVTSTSHL